MHILLVPSWYSTPENPIRGSFFRDQARALHNAGHQVGILVPPSKFRTWHGLTEFRRHWRRANTDVMIEHEDDIPIYRIPWWGWRPMLDLSARGELALRIFDLYTREHGRPDILHAHSALYGGFIAAHIKQQRRQPVVLTEHSSALVRGLIFPDQRISVRRTLTLVDRILAVGAPLAQRLQRYCPNAQIEIVGNAVDTALFTLSDLHLPASPFIFAIVARLNPNKGVDVLLKAFGRAFKDQQVVLNIGGDGAQRQRLERLTYDVGIQKQVSFLGLLSREQSRDLMQQSHAIISSSYVETFGVTLIEALACGKPVVATRSGGPEMFVTDSNGLLVPPGDVDALAAAMQALKTNYDRYNPQQIRAECVTRFSEEAIVGRLEEIYREVLAPTS